MKIQIIKFYLQDKDVLQQYLDDMAHQGWYLNRMSTSFLLFERKDKPCYFIIDYNYNILKNQNVIDDKTANEKSSKYATRYLKKAHTSYFNVYASLEQPNDYPETILSADAFHKVKKHLYWRYCWLPILVIFCAFTICYGYPQLFLFLFSYNITIVLMLLLLISFPVCIYVVFKNPPSSIGYNKHIKQLKKRTFFTLLFDTLSFIFLISVFILANHSQSLDGTISWAIVGLFIVESILNQLDSKKSYIKLILFAGFLYFSLDFLYSHVLTIYHPTVIASSIFSSDVTLINEKEGECKTYQSFLIKYTSCAQKNEETYFDYEQYNCRYDCITDLAMRSLTKNRKVRKTYEYKNVEVYTPVKDGLLEMERKYKWQPFIILRKGSQLISLTSNDNFHKDRIIKIINELHW